MGASLCPVTYLVSMQTDGLKLNLTLNMSDSQSSVLTLILWIFLQSQNAWINESEVPHSLVNILLSQLIKLMGLKSEGDSPDLPGFNIT